MKQTCIHPSLATIRLRVVHILSQDEALEVVPVLKREVEKLQLNLSKEASGREEDLHIKDGEIAMLKAKVRNAAPPHRCPR